MIPLAENAAVLDPAACLTTAEQQALLGIGQYRRQARRAGFVLVGPRQVAPSVLANLRAKELIKGEPPTIGPTVGGQLAIEKLLGRNRERNRKHG